MTRRVIDADFHAKNLVNALFAGLHVAGKKFGLLINLLDDAFENLVAERVDTNLSFLAELNSPKLGFRDVNADVNLILLEKRGDWCVRRNQIAWTHVENFDNRVRRSDDLSFAEA